MKLDFDRLKEMCTLDEIDLWARIVEGDFTPSSAKDTWFEHTYLYADRGASVLAVAHLDTVGTALSEDFSTGHLPGHMYGRRNYLQNTYSQIDTGRDTVVFSPALDDRLGVYSILDLLPQMGIKVDVLFTTGEESGQTSAEDFRVDRKYNWIVEFDRAGSDVVLYQYDDVPDLAQDLKMAGFKIGYGSYSDISDLDDLKVGAFNVGIGYHFQHSSRCCASMLELSHQMDRFAAFYHEYKDKRYTYTASRRGSKRDYWRNYPMETVTVWKGGRLDLDDTDTVDDDIYLSRYGMVQRDRYEF